MGPPRADPINAALATEGIRALSQGLPPLIATDPPIAWKDASKLFTAPTSPPSHSPQQDPGCTTRPAMSLAGPTTSPHAQTHAAVLPYVLAFNGAHAPDAAARIAAAFGTADALTGLQELRKRLDAPKALSDYGFTAEGIAEAVPPLILPPAVPASNPRPVTAQDLTRLLQAALNGEDPAILLDR